MKIKHVFDIKMTGETFEKFHLPFIKQFVSVNTIKNVLEIGESKVSSLEVLKENSCNVITIDVKNKEDRLWNKERIEEKLFREISEDEGSQMDKVILFDLIIVNDLSIQTPERQILLETLMQFLNLNGSIFICFRPKFWLLSEYSIEKFRDFIMNTDYIIKAEKLYLIDPDTCVKHNFRPYEVAEKIRRIPYIRYFFSSFCSYIITKQTYYVQVI